VSRTNVVAVVVAYNRQELLRRCLDSLAEQTVALTGTVVVDNASTDSSREVASTHPLGAHVVLTLVNMLFVQSLVVADIHAAPRPVGGAENRALPACVPPGSFRVKTTGSWSLLREKT